MAINRISSSSGRLRGTYVAIMIPLGVAINYVGGMVATSLGLPVYLDSIGTVVAASIMGPWVGSSAGVLFNVISAFSSGNIMSSLFGLCNIATGLTVGFMARNKKFKTILHALIAAVISGMLNAIISAPIAVIVYGGLDGNVGTNLLIAGANALGNSMMISSIIGRIPTNLIDKGIACVIAWTILKKLPENMKSLSGGKMEA